MLELNTYHRQRDALLNITRRLATRTELDSTIIALTNSEQSVRRIVDVVTARLSSRTFRILVAGEFNAGKSYFINTLLGKWRRDDPASGTVPWRGLLAVDILPATTLLTEIVAGPRLQAVLHTRKGTAIPLPLSQLANITSLKSFDVESSIKTKLEPMPTVDENGSVAQSRAIAQWLYGNVDRVVIETPNNFVAGGITIVDSPGLGAIYEEHRLVTVAEMRVSDCIIFLLDSGSPLSRTAEDFLLDARQFVDSFFFVQTKTDQRSWDAVERVMRYNVQRLRSIAGDHGPQLFPISARVFREGGEDAIRQSGFAELLRSLESFLVEHAGRRYLSSERRLIELALTALIDSEKNRRAAATMDSNALQRRLDLCAAHAADSRSTEASITDLITYTVKEMSVGIAADQSGLTQDLMDAMKRGVLRLDVLDRFFADNAKLLAEIRIAAQSIVFERLRPRIERAFREMFQDAQNSLDESMRRWLSAVIPQFAVPAMPAFDVSFLGQL